MTVFAFYALGIPGPQGSKTNYGKGRTVESSKKVRPWREAVKAAAPTCERPLDGPLAVKMVFTLPRPISAPKRLLRPATTPDLSKLARSTEDAITEAGLWKDDARLSEYVRLAKVWAGFDPDALPVPGVIVACCELSDLDPDDALWKPFDDCRFAAWERIRGDAGAYRLEAH